MNAFWSCTWINCVCCRRRSVKCQPYLCYNIAKAPWQLNRQPVKSSTQLSFNLTSAKLISGELILCKGLKFLFLFLPITWQSCQFLGLIKGSWCSVCCWSLASFCSRSVGTFQLCCLNRKPSFLHPCSSPQKIVCLFHPISFSASRQVFCEGQRRKKGFVFWSAS